MTLVQVEDARHDVQSMQCLQAPDAEQELLADPHTYVAAVEPRRQSAILRRVALDIGVEQQQGAPPDGRLPDPRAQRPVAGLDLQRDRLAVRPHGRLERQLGDIHLRVFLLLPAGGVEPLTEVALAIEQSDTDERYSQVRGALDVVAGQHAQPAGVDRQRFVDPEFGREVGDRLAPQDPGVRVAPGRGTVPVLLQPAERVIDPVRQRQVADALVQIDERHLRQQGHGVAPQLVPTGRIEIPEQAHGAGVPAPPHVPGKRPESALEWPD